MNIEKYKIDCSKLKVGDKLWSIQLGDCKMIGRGINAKLERRIVCENINGSEVYYTFTGYQTEKDAFPSLFTSNPFAEEHGEQITLSGPISVHFGKCGTDPEDEPEVPEKPESILQEAERLINGDRASQYGDAKENFGDIAKGWSVLFKTHVTAEQVAIAMIWLKMCRFNHKEGRDSIVDIAGYAGCVEKIQKGGVK